MEQINSKKRFLVIKLINHKMQFFLLIFIWILFILSYFFTNNLVLIIFWFILSFCLTMWGFTVKLSINYNKVIYTSGFLKRELDISSIQSISSSLNVAGANMSRDLTIKSSDSTKKDIKFNIRYFSKKDFTKFLKTIVSLKQDIALDKQMIKLLQSNI